MKNSIRLINWSAFFSGMSFFRPMLTLYFISKGVALEHVIFSQTVYSALNFIAEVPTGVIGDKFGHKNSVILGKVVSILPFVVYVLSPNTLGLYVSFALLGLADALVSGSEEAFLHSVSEPGTFKKNNARFLSNDLFGGVIGTATSGLAYWLFGTKGFVLLIILNVLARLLATAFYFVLKDSPVVRDGTQLRATLLFTQGIKQIWMSPTLRSLTIVKMLTIGAQYVLYGIYQPYFEQYGVQPVFIGLVLTFGLLSNGVVVRQVHRLGKYISIEKTVLLLPILMACTYLLFSFVKNPWLLIFVFILLQAQFNLLDPIVSDYVNFEAADESRATVISGISMLSTVANTLSKFVLGIVIGLGGVVAMFRFQFVYLVIGAFLSWWLLRRCGCTYVIPVHVEEK